MTLGQFIFLNSLLKYFSSFLPFNSPFILPFIHSSSSENTFCRFILFLFFLSLVLLLLAHRWVIHSYRSLLRCRRERVYSKEGEQNQFCLKNIAKGPNINSTTYNYFYHLSLPSKTIERVVVPCFELLVRSDFYFLMIIVRCLCVIHVAFNCYTAKTNWRQQLTLMCMFHPLKVEAE